MSSTSVPSPAAFTGYKLDWAAQIARLTVVDLDGEPVRITSTAKLVAWSLAKRLNVETGQCNPSQETLVADTATSLAGVKRAVALLRRIGALSVSYGQGKRAAYELLQIAHAGPADDASEGSGMSHQMAHRRANQKAHPRAISSRSEKKKAKVKRGTRTSTDPQKDWIRDLGARKKVPYSIPDTSAEAHQEIQRLLALPLPEVAPQQGHSTCYQHDRLVTHAEKSCPVCEAERQAA